MDTHSFTVDGTRQVYHVAGSGPVMITHAGGPGVDSGYLRSARLEEHLTMIYPASLEYVDRHAGIPEVAAVREALGEFGQVKTDEDKTRVLAAAMPVYFADFWGERRAEYEAVRAGLRAWVTPFQDSDFDVRAELGSITAPTVVLTGRHDFICGPRWAKMLHAGIPGSRLVILEDSGHFAQIEEPDAFVAAVSAVRSS